MKRGRTDISEKETPYKRAYIDPDLEYKDTLIWEPLLKYKIKKIDIVNNDWVSGSELANYFLKDPVLDWLKYYYRDYGLNEHYDKRRTRSNTSISEKNLLSDDEYINFLMEAGRKFEALVNEEITRKFGADVVKIAENGRDSCNQKNFKKTVDAIKKGVPIILQGVLMDKKTKLRGITDIIIRSDYLNKLTRRKEMFDNDIYKKGAYLSGDYHYVIIDIKWTGMTLCANGKSIRNEGRMRAYKGQLALYNFILGKIQGYIPRYAYIMAKSWTIDNKQKPETGVSCFDLLGTIDYMSFDRDSIIISIEAIDWIKKVKTLGQNWSPLHPHIPEMYPNASNTYDNSYAQIKKKLIDELHEITKVWYVSPEHRNRALEQNITKWSDPKCTTEALGLKDSQKTKVIAEILSINQQDNDKIRPSKIKSTNEIPQNPEFALSRATFRHAYWFEEDVNDFTVDFETINDCLNIEDMDIYDSGAYTNIIFMIGVGWTENNRWNYINFTMNEYTLQEETRIVDEFTDFILKKSAELNKHKQQKYRPRLYHWAVAEQSSFCIVNNRNNQKWDRWLEEIDWVDMCNVFVKEPIVVKGAHNFKLKEIGNAMYTHKMINTKWDNNMNGLTAMYQAIKYYEKVMKKELSEDDKKTMDTIIKYNEVDCKVVWEILRYLRANLV
uniref:Uncharacterized protein n=1 Tax=viral metagenome TaxID=1070528 RepID=A0A6C0EEJ6_9ZZZZ